MNVHRRGVAAVVLTAAVGAALACGAAKTGNGQLAVQLVDAPNPAVDEIWVNVTAVRAHVVGSGWTNVTTGVAPPIKVDLLKLKDYALPLGLVSLPAGTVTQLRLVVASDGNSVVTGGAEVPLKVPSGAESGIKIKGPWEISACTQTAITLDFDGEKSIWYHPTTQGDEWILRPVIRTKKVERSPSSCGDEGDTGGPPPPPTPGTCDPANPVCAEGQVCVAGTCVGTVGATCQQGSQCASGTCDATGHCGPGGFGSPCSGAGECLSGICATGACGAGGPGVPCQVAADCASGTCGVDGTCAAGAATGGGTSCTLDSQCLSNACVEGTCSPGLQGAPCTTAQDCTVGLACTAGSCSVPL